MDLTSHQLVKVTILSRTETGSLKIGRVCLVSKMIVATTQEVPAIWVRHASG